MHIAVAREGLHASLAQFLNDLSHINIIARNITKGTMIARTRDRQWK
jgi:hypothetical protein